MKLQYIELTNFRQFKGTQRFSLEPSKGKPVSLVFGANGSGKTTLLNAFTWALYGSMSDDVESQERMATDIVWRDLTIGSNLQISVELGFDHESTSYRLLRSAEVRKESDDQPRTLVPEVKLWSTGSGGQSTTVSAPGEKVASILPNGISRFFFFNGERIEKLVQKGAYGEIKQDIKALLNIEHVERAIEHLPKADRKIAATLKDRGGDQASEIQKEIERLEDRDGILTSQIQRAESDLSTFKNEREGVYELLQKNAAVAPIQERRTAAEIDLESSRNELDAARSEHRNLIGTRGFVAFTLNLVNEIEATAADLYQKGALPTPLKREFVDKLLDDESCICGSELRPGSPSRMNVEDWRSKAGLQAVETAWQELNGQIKPLKSERDEFQTDLQNSARRIVEAEDRMARLVAEVSELTGKLKETNLEEVERLEDKRVELDKLISARMSTVSSSRAEIEENQKVLTQRKRELEKVELNDTIAKKSRDRLQLIRNVKTALDEILEIRSKDMRKRLEAELQRVFTEISIKRYTPRLSDEFELTLHQDVDGVELQVPKSTGENQILSISFVAAVSKLAREIQTVHSAEGAASADAGSYPIVIDAAFGSLDKNYQKQVARALADMAPQLVVLVSKSQGLGDVIRELAPRVNNMGVVVTNTTSTRDVSETIEINGVDYAYITSGARANYSELKVVK